MNISREQYFEKTVAAAEALLERWKGATATMWELTVSHKSLSLLLTSSTRTGNLMLACLDPIRIRGPIKWETSDISISAIPLSGSCEDHGFLVTDERADLEVLCGGIEVKENVKLY